MARQQKDTKADELLNASIEAAKKTIAKAKPKKLKSAESQAPAPALKSAGEKPVIKKTVAKRAGGEVKINRMRGRGKTGANVPFSQTVTPETANLFYALQERTGVTMGTVLARAAQALERELNGD